jgi:hypothetical protein
MKNQKFAIITPQSNIGWVGKKVTGAHNGTIAIKEGEVILNDTTSIKILDVTDPDLNAQFWGHLASDDFFSSEKYPEAVLEITSVDGNHVDGNLTIKDITHAIGFDVAINVNGDILTATGLVVVDRTKYGMKFRSGNFFQNLGDTLIYNDFELNVNITAKAV